MAGIGWPLAALGGLLLGLAPSSASAQANPVDAPPFQRSEAPLTYGEAEQRLRSVSSLGRAADYGLQSAGSLSRVADGLNRPTVSLDAQVLRYRKTFDLALGDTLDRAQADLSASIPGLLSELPNIPGEVLDAVGQRLQSALPEIFAGLPRDIRLQIDETAFRPTVSVVQPLYTGGAIPALRRAASANVELAQARKREAIDLESVNLARAYFGQVLAAQSLQIALDTRDGFDLHLANARRMEAEGVLSHAQTLQVEVARDAAQRQVNRAELEYENAVASLAAVTDLDTGVSPTTSLFVNRDPVGPLSVFLESAERSNSRVAQAGAGQDLAEAGVDLARSRLRPSVFAFGTYNLNRESALPIEPDWAVGVSAHYTLMSSVDRRALLGAARAQAYAATEAERQARDDARLLVTRAFNQVDLARRQFLSLDSSLEAARENLRVQEISFREGEGTAAAVIDARNLLGGARVQRAAAAYEYDLSLAALLAAAGDGRSLTDYLERDDRINTP